MKDEGPSALLSRCMHSCVYAVDLLLLVLLCDALKLLQYGVSVPAAD